MRRAVFLDRDGVLNDSIIRNNKLFSPRNVDEVFIADDVIKSVELLKLTDFILVVVTNQPDISRGLLKIESLEQINDLVRAKTGIEHFYVCPHDDFDNCICRKPKPGLLHRAAKDLNINLLESYMIGDQIRDIKAGVYAGCKSSFLLSKNSDSYRSYPYMKVYSTLLEIINNILEL